MSISPRNLVLLCDGTNNEVKQDLTNVLKLYRIAVRGEEQLVFYDPGIGTIGLNRDWSHLRKGMSALFGLATGWVLDDNILDAYAFLCREWREGARSICRRSCRG